jgi:GTPase SAR1 family protein
MITLFIILFSIGEYSERQVSTLQASYLDKRVVVGGSEVQLSIWDTAGQERFHALGECRTLLLYISIPALSFIYYIILFFDLFPIRFPYYLELS